MNSSVWSLVKVGHHKRHVCLTCTVLKKLTVVVSVSDDNIR